MAIKYDGKGQIALITGASSGIGKAMARRFAKHNFDLVLVARSADKLEALADEVSSVHGINAKAVPADLSEPGAAKKLAVSLKRGRHEVHVLVNNAGTTEFGAFVDIPAERHQQLIDLNITGLTGMLAHFVPPMVARGRGRVLNVASIAGFQPVPMLASYAATKAYVLSITEALSEELAGTGVSVTALCPGITATEMLDSARKANTVLADLPGIVVGDAESVANEGFEACMRGEVIRVPGALNQAAMLASRATPKWLLRRVSGAVARRLR
jgi:uncharacterized protein